MALVTNSQESLSDGDICRKQMEMLEEANGFLTFDYASLLPFRLISFGCLIQCPLLISFVAVTLGG